jgi:hypothetical protein
MIEDLVKETVEKFLAYAPQVEKLFQKTVIEDRPPIRSGKQEASGMQGNAGHIALEEILEGFRSLQGPNLETGIQGDRADRILYVREEGLAGLFGPYGYRYP